jgi:membrane fusion protein (multidrug efflux system)
MIPDSALVTSGDHSYTWRVNGKSLSKVNLDIGARDPRTGQWEVKSGLNNGDRVLRVPNSGYKDGQGVEMAAANVKTVAPAAAPAQASAAPAAGAAKGN